MRASPCCQEYCRNVSEPSSIRNTLRADRIARREALSPVAHAHCSTVLEAHLAAFLNMCQPEVLGFCWPYRAEFDCRALIARWIERGTRACLPLVDDSVQAMRFREWQPASVMTTDRYGIPYPASGAILQPDLLLIPVNAFDAQGFRLGYGKGHFDQTLAAAHPRPLAVGVGFELARVATIYPQAHDIAMDAVVTEAGPELFSPRARRLMRPTS
jgi:5-formyltetrahydrofolate cyclo-ligase